MAERGWGGTDEAMGWERRGRMTGWLNGGDGWMEGMPEYMDRRMGNWLNR